MSGKRIVFSTVTPNDQGGVIPNSSIDFATRFNVNPVVLCQHDWNAPPLGLMTDIKEENGELSGIPVFNKITKDSKEYAALYEGGWIKACSIGGEAEWKTNGAGQPVLTKEGHRQCEKFVLYEISIVTLPSNPDAVTKEQLAARIYEKADLQTISNQIVTLSSKYKIPPMEPKIEDVNKTPEQVKLDAAQKALDDAKAEKEAADKVRLAAADPSATQLPGVIQEIVRGQNNLLGKVVDFLTGGGKKVDATKLEVPTPQGKPTSTIKDPTQDQPTPIGLDAKRAEAKKKAEEAKEAASAATSAAASAKEKAEKEGSSQEDKDGYAAAYSAAEKACNDALEAEEAYKSCMDATDDADMAAREKAAKEKKAAGAAKTTLAAGGTEPKLKTMDELQAKLKLAAPPAHRAKIMTANGVPFSKLTAKDNAEGQRILGRVMTADSGKDISDYAILLDSIMNDGKYAAIVDKTRIIANISEGQFNAYRRSGVAQERAGLNLKNIADQLHSGAVDVMGRDNVVRKMTTLTSTDNALASPALNTIEWLSLAIFNLFPSTSWKNDIPMFGAQMTSENTGIIWANIAADPAITFGTQPVSPADYVYNDVAVSLTLIPSWLQPMRWTPLTMHQLRYDQMATGWAQAFAKWGAAIDDRLIYILASTVPAASIIQTIGQTSGQVPKSSFNILNANDPNSFYYNPAFTGALATPAYNDITRIEQVYNKQNFQLDREKAVLVVDPTQDAFISLDPDTKSLLTRFIKSDDADVLKIKHTVLTPRSRVAIYDPATSQVKDPAGVIPATSVSAGIGFLPSQIGIGLGILDVFMIQDPTSYGYRMSADIREGIVPLRANFNGTTLYTYGSPTV